MLSEHVAIFENEDICRFLQINDPSDKILLVKFYRKHDKESVEEQKETSIRLSEKSDNSVSISKTSKIAKSEGEEKVLDLLRDLESKPEMFTNSIATFEKYFFAND